MIGLNNYGNNCYFNSVIQFLTSSTYFKDYLDTEKIDDTILKEIKVISSSKDSNENKTLSTINIHKNITNRTSLFKIGRQEDSHELLVFMLDLINENKLEKCKTLYNNKYSFSNFCQTCKTIREQNDNTNVLSVCITPETNTLIDCIKNYLKYENFDIDCDTCKKNTKQLRKIFLKNFIFPKILFIHLKRFSFTNNRVKKNKQVIDFARQMSLNNKTYNLKSIIIHIGEYGSGHYITISVTEKSDEWLLYNDSHVSKITEVNKQLFYQNTYMFLYELESE